MLFVVFPLLGLRYGQCEPEGEVRGGLEEGDQETPEVQRPNQDLDSVQRNQGQEG